MTGNRKSPGLVGAQRDHEHPNTQKAGPREDRPDSTDRSLPMMPEPTDTPMPTAADLLEPLPSPVPLLSMNPNPTPRPSAAAPPRPSAARTRRIKSAKQRSYAIARLYCERHPLIRQAAVAAIVLKAIEDGRFTDGEIKDAVTRLARANWRVTEDTLRVELEEKTGRRPLLPQKDHRHPVSEASVVYVIGSKQARPVKIGTSINSGQRLASIQMMSPVILEILHEHPGEYDLEAWLHNKFRRYRLHGEWFDFGDLNPVETVQGGISEYERRRRVDEIESNAAARRQNQVNLREVIFERHGVASD
jgi:hypothetical protein